MLSTGISVITHTGLGTGTISSVALVLSKALPLSMGFFVFLTNVFFFVLQTAVDPSRFLVKLVKQIPICFVFGLFFDAAYALTSFVAPAAYLEQLATVFIGTVFNGMGIAGMVFARLAILPPEQRQRRLRAITRFPLLVAPVLLTAHHQLECGGGKRHAWRAHDDAVIEAIDRGRDLVGVLERIGERRWRLVTPWPAAESNLDLLELVPAPPSR